MRQQTVKTADDIIDYVSRTYRNPTEREPMMLLECAELVKKMNQEQGALVDMGEKVGTFNVNTGLVLIGDPAQFVNNPDKTPLLTFDRLQEMHEEQGKRWVRPAIFLEGNEVIPAQEQVERATVVAVDDGSGGTAGVVVTVGTDGFCPVYLRRNKDGNPERLTIEIGKTQP
jgi:hypothetical protein